MTTSIKIKYPVTPPIKYGGKSLQVNPLPNNAAPNEVARNCVSHPGFHSCMNSRIQVNAIAKMQIGSTQRRKGKIVNHKVIQKTT